MTGEQPRRVRAVEPSSEVDGRLMGRIRQDFPEVLAWYGKATGSWWAMVPVGDRWRLVEAADPVELRAAIRRPEGWPWPRNAVALPSTAPGMSAPRSRGTSRGTSRGMSG